MKSSSHPSLTHRASIVVVSSLWNRTDVVADIMGHLLSDRMEDAWPDLENKVLQRLPDILLPHTLSDHLKNFIQPMGREILKWVALTKPTFRACANRSLPTETDIVFYWTERGALDYVRTTRRVIDRVRDPTMRFCLAGTFCMEEVIFRLWPEVAEKDARKVETVTVVYWVYHMRGEVEDLMTLTEYCGARDADEFAFLLTLDTRCLDALGYFLRRVRPERRQRLVLSALDKIFRTARPYDGSVMTFLLDRVEEESAKNRLLEQNPYCVLASLLEWPCQEFFLPVANASWDHLSGPDFLNLFQDVVSCVSKYGSDGVYKNIAKSFWRSSPGSFKEYAIAKCTSGTFLSRLFLRDNTDEVVAMILNDCTPDERRRMMFYFEGMNICDLLVKRERWNALKLFVTSCIPNRDVLCEFVVQYETSKPCYCNEETALRTDVLMKKMTEWF